MCNHMTGPRARQPRFNAWGIPFEVFEAGEPGQALVVPFPPEERAWAFVMDRNEYGSMRIKRITVIDRARLKGLRLLNPGKYPNCGTDHGDAANAWMAHVPENLKERFIARANPEEPEPKRNAGKSIRY